MEKKTITHCTVWAAIEAVRKASPLVHNITNFVVMQITANALLSFGASPIMAHAPEELDEIIQISDALVVNIGTLDEGWIGSMTKAVTAARRKGIPVVIDPVGAGASRLRTETALKLIALSHQPFVRGNASEIMALAGEQALTRGVDSTQNAHTALNAAQALAQKYSGVVSVSGAEDIITDGINVFTVHGGSELMPRVTGMGCTASALLGAFAAVFPQEGCYAPLCAMLTMAVCGEIAKTHATGPGSFSVHFIDALYSISSDDIISKAIWHEF